MLHATMRGAARATLVALTLAAVGAAVARTLRERVEYVPPVVMQVGVGRGYAKAADLFRGSLNESADPCHDFFDFACGKWVAENAIPADQTSNGHFSEIREKVNREMKDLYEEKAPSTSRSINVLKQFYNACMDLERINSLGSTALLSEVKSFGYWPAVHGSRWVEADFDMGELMTSLAQSRALDVFVDIYVSQDQKNVSRRMLHFDQGGLGLGSSARDYYLNETKYAKQLNAYERLMIDRITLLVEDAGTNRTHAQIVDDVKDLLAFEKRLAQTLVSEDDRRNYTRMYNLRRFNDLNTLIPIIDWQSYFRALMPHDLHAYLNENPYIVVSEPEFFLRLAKLLNETNKRTLANYMIWRFTGAMSLQLDERFEHVSQDFLRDFIGKRAASPRWKDCSSAMSMRFAYASGAMYVRRHFTEASRVAAVDMVADIRDAFTSMLELNTWLQPETKAYALKKAHDMLSLIGFPDMALNDTLLDDYYKLLNVSERDEAATYAALVQRYSNWAQQKAFRRLVEAVDRTEFGTSSAVVNAFYSSVRNQITFPAAILQAPFFDLNFPKAVNYGGIGSVIGHEISHGYDDSGSQFDKEGNLYNWWDETTAERFRNLTNCVAEQYSGYEVEGTGMRINGNLTLGENIADNAGIRSAYRAYRAYIAKQGHEEKKVPGYDYSNNQIFYISYAQTWCGHSKPEAAIRQLLVDPHSAMRWRVNGVVSNQPEFAHAFSCPATARMAPAKRCIVW